MNVTSVLFGVDVAAIVVSLWKMTFTEYLPDVPEKVKRPILAFLIASAVLIVGLQAQGYILPPETEQVVNLALTTIAAFLVVMGYGPEVGSLGRAGVDLIKLSAVHLWVEAVSKDSVMPVKTEAGSEDPTILVLLSRYRLQ